MKYFLTAILTIVMASILIFAFQNTQNITLNFINYQTNVLSGVIILASVLVGAILALIVVLPNLLISKYKNKDLLKEIDKLKTRLKNETIEYESEGLGSEGVDYKEKRG